MRIYLLLVLLLALSLLVTGCGKDKVNPDVEYNIYKLTGKGQQICKNKGLEFHTIYTKDSINYFALCYYTSPLRFTDVPVELD